MDEIMARYERAQAGDQEFAAAVALAWRIIRAGYKVEALSCREDGRYTGWYVCFLGGQFDSRVYTVRNTDEWAYWLSTSEQRRRARRCPPP